MRTQSAPEIVINACQLTQALALPQFEFVLNYSLQVVDCGLVTSPQMGLIKRVNDPARQLHDALFELNHVRVNPNLDNTKILSKFAMALKSAGVEIINPPAQEMMSVCYKPMGELTDIVRFTIKANNDLNFLSRSRKLKLVK